MMKVLSLLAEYLPNYIFIWIRIQIRLSQNNVSGNFQKRDQKDKKRILLKEYKKIEIITSQKDTPRSQREGSRFLRLLKLNSIFIYLVFIDNQFDIIKIVWNDLSQAC